MRTTDRLALVVLLLALPGFGWPCGPSGVGVAQASSPSPLPAADGPGAPKDGQKADAGKADKEKAGKTEKAEMSEKSDKSGEKSGDESGAAHDDHALPKEVAERFALPDGDGTPEKDPGKKIEAGAFDYSLEMLDLDLKDIAHELELAVEAKNPVGFAKVLTDDFRGSIFEGGLVSHDGPRMTKSGASMRFVDGRDAFVKGLVEFLSDFDVVYDGFFKVKQYLGESTTRRVVGLMKFDLRALRKDGSVHQEHDTWQVAFTRPTDVAEWKIDRLFLVSREQHDAPAPMFRDVTTAAGLYVTEPPACGITGLGNIQTEEHRTQYDYGGVCVYDIDGDGDLDVFMPNAYGPFCLFLNKGDGTFENEIDESGIFSFGGTRGAVLGDLDNDGDADLFICRAPFHHPSIGRASNSLFENLGNGKFREVTKEAGLVHIGASMSAVFLDYDNDGDLDIFVADYGYGEAYNSGAYHPYNNTGGKPNHLYRNDGDLKFTDVTKEAGLGDETYWSYAVAVIDWNKDRYPDIYIANDFAPNSFFVNQGDGTFKESAKELGVEDVGNGMGATFVDYNDDGRWDLYVTNMQSSTGQRVLKTASSIVSDDDMKLLWKLTLGNSLYCGSTDGKFAPSIAQDLGINATGWAWNADFADFDADTDLDLYVLNGYYSGVQAKDC